MIIDGELVVSKKKKNALVIELKEKGFKPFPKVAEAVKAGEDEQAAEDEGESDASDHLSNAYDYLLGMAIWSLTQERVERLRRQIGDKEVEIDTLIKLSKEDIWKHDLDEFINEWRFQLEDEDRRLRKAARMGRRTSSKLMTGGKAPAARKRKAAAGDDPDDEDFAAPKSKKPATKKVEPKGGLLNYLSKPSTKKAASPSDGAGDSDEDFGMEVLPKKSRTRPKAEPKPEPKPECDDDSVVEAIPKSRGASKPAAKDKDEDDIFNMDDDAPQEVAPPKPASETQEDDIFNVEESPKKGRGASKAKSKPSDDDDFIEVDADDVEEPPKKAPSRGAAKPKPKPSDDDDFMEIDADDFEVDEPPKKGRGAGKGKSKAHDDSDDEFMEIAKASSKQASQPSRASRKPVKYTAMSESESDNGDDLLGDVSTMVKGIGGSKDSASDSRQLFSERSRPGSSSGLRTSAKTSKFSNDFDPDETDYSKLVPQNSPRRSLQVKSKDVKMSEDDDMDKDDEPAKPAMGKQAAKGKAAAPKTTAPAKGRGRPKKDAAKPAPAPAPTQLSPAAKAYASKKAKASKKQVADGSDDDIDAMANDILDSPAGKAGSEDEAPAPAPKAASRPSRRTAAKKTYVIDDDSEEYGGGDSDDFDDDSE